MNDLIILIGGIVIGILGVLVGATQFLSMPFFQLTNPAISYAQMIGNIKTGGFFRGLASTASTRKHLNFPLLLQNLAPFILGTVLGTFLTTKIDQSFLLPIIIAAIIISELSPKIAHLITPKTRLLFTFLIGIYGGFIGAGISILILGLLRTIFPKEDDLVFVKIQANAVELLGSTVIFITNLFYGNILWPLVIYWSIGMFIGGYLGGHVLKKSIHISKKAQRNYVYLIYIIALIPSLLKLFS